MIESPNKAFAFCPSCGAARDQKRSPSEGNLFQCQECDFHYYFNPALAVGAIIEGPENQVLFIRRERDPGKGKLGLPGGFADMGETAEDALRREVVEEIGLELDSCHYLTSFPNQYVYRKVRYQITDLFFVCRVANIENIRLDPSEIRSWQWAPSEEVTEESMAFRSNWQALEYYRCPNK